MDIANDAAWQPLADRMRPRRIDDVVGQAHLLAPGNPLRVAIESGALHSLVFWGPPGTGKTTLAHLIAAHVDAAFVALSAVYSGVKDIRNAIEQARTERAQGRRTVLFVDEVHRFNKGQQDAFLPYIEDGTVVFIGATTENPSFELNSALLSRARVYVLRPLATDDLRAVLKRARSDTADAPEIASEALDILAAAADGDARRALNLLEIAMELARAEGHAIDRDTAARVATGGVRRFDKGGDVFYDQISALHKSVRGSDPDAALYWFARMLDGGCDPRYVARRVVRMASEDIGNADPRALALALDAWDVQERLGSPEAELTLAQAVVYLACCAKSNAVYIAFRQAQAAVQQHGSLEVPLHLRNASTRLSAELGHGRDYRYAHDEPDAYAAGENYFPEGMPRLRFYQPTERGLEARIGERLAELRRRNQAAKTSQHRLDGEG